MNAQTLTPGLQTSVIPDAERGAMGLRGPWAQVFHSTAMVAMVVILFLVLGEVHLMHEQSIATLRDFNTQLIGQIKGAIDSNTLAIEHLANDIRNLRSQP